MLAFIRALSAESLKLRRTLALWLVLLAPLSIAFLSFVLFQQRGDYMVAGPWGAWKSLAQNALILWSMLMLPLFVTLESALLAQLEHGNHTWKHLYALPSPRWATYAAKQVVSLAVIAASSAVMIGLIVAAGLVLRLTRPGLGFEAALPWRLLAEAGGAGLLGAWLSVALHTFVSLRWPSFVVACGVGIMATIAGVVVLQSDWALYYPWTLPAFVQICVIQGSAYSSPVLLSLALGAVVALGGAWEVLRRDVA